MILGLLFWPSIILSLHCSFKAKKYKNPPGNDILFLLSGWLPFNLGIWHKYFYLCANIPEKLAFPLAAMILILLSLIFIKKRGLKPNSTNSASQDISCAIRWLIILAAGLLSFGFFFHFIQWNPKTDANFIIEKIVDYFILVATTEELIFRAIIFNLLNKKLRGLPAIILTSIIFSLTPSHIAGQGIFPNWKYVGMAFFAGLFYAGSYRESKNILVPIFLHGFTDTFWRIFLS